MSWTRFAATVSAAVLAGWAATASADDEYGRSGPYVALGATYAFEEFSGPANGADSTWGYHAAGGFRFNEYFALEVTGEQYFNFDASGGNVDLGVAAVSGKVYPFSGIVQPYLAAGAGWAWIDDDRGDGANDERGSTSNGFAARFAGGVDFYVARNWVLFAEVGYMLPTTGGGDYDVVPLSFGVQYRFF